MNKTNKNNLNVNKKLELAVVVAFMIFSFLPQFASAAQMASADIIELVNRARENASTSAVQESATLDEAAKLKAEDMFARQYFAHTSPEGVSPWHWFDAVAYDYDYAGENLAMGFEDVSLQHRAWMDSATHRKNILNPKFSEIGIAIKEGVLDGKKTTLVVELFGKTQDASLGTVAAAQAARNQKNNPVGLMSSDIENSAHHFNIWLVLTMIIMASLAVDLIYIYRREHEKAFLLGIARR